MSRRIVTRANETTAASNPIDGYFDRILKYIPADVVGAWIAVTGIIPKKEAHRLVPWIALLVGIAATALWTWRQTTVRDQARPAVTQIAIASIAFLVWVFALGWPFDTRDWYRGYYGALALIGYSLVVGAIVPKE